jgi:hypothetical protein
LGLDVRMPHSLFAGKLNPYNEAALILKHTAFRDDVQNRRHLAILHRELADQIYARKVDYGRLDGSPLAATVRDILKGKGA